MGGEQRPSLPNGSPAADSPTQHDPLLALPACERRQSTYVIPVVNPKSPKPPQLYDLYEPSPNKRNSLNSRRIASYAICLVVLALITIKLLAPHRLPPLPNSFKPYTVPLQRVYDEHSHLLPGAAGRWRDSLFVNPSMPLDEDEIAIREASAEHDMTVIMLHDLGDPQDRLPLHHRMAGNYPNIKWVAPQARNLSVSVFDDVPLSGWYDVRHTGQLHWDEDETGMIESHRQINQVIQRERRVFADAGKTPRVVIVGFSQGAVMGLLATIASSEPIEALIMISGYLPLPLKMHRIGSMASFARETPIFWGHGREDPDVDIEDATADVVSLRRPPFMFENLRFRVYDDLRHDWSEDELDDIVKWFSKNVASPPNSRQDDSTAGESKPNIYVY
ncbi:hypothetical protein OIO90_006029 [Microbotryomycetes sp. JL221]|nr:hypothetical protein OIO90_006029 [Microbotryomycetes sp. JL221]